MMEFIDWIIQNYYSQNALILSIILALIIVVYLLRRKPSVLKAEYLKHSYWERRYYLHDKHFEWYAETKKTFNDFELEKFFISNFKDKSKFLEIGCGTSNFSYELAKIGFKNIYATDYSQSAIDILKEKFPHSKISYLRVDFYHLINHFTENEIDCVIDKAGLDTINTLSDMKEASNKMKQVFHQIYKILKPGGYLITISNKNFEHWNLVIHNYLEEKKLFVVVDRKQQFFVKEGEDKKWYYYCYILKKI